MSERPDFDCAHIYPDGMRCRLGAEAHAIPGMSHHATAEQTSSEGGERMSATEGAGGERRLCGPCRRGQSHVCDGNEYLHCDNAAEPDAGGVLIRQGGLSGRKAMTDATSGQRDDLARVLGEHHWGDDTALVGTHAVQCGCGWKATDRGYEAPEVEGYASRKWQQIATCAITAQLGNFPARHLCEECAEVVTRLLDHRLGDTGDMALAFDEGMAAFSRGEGSDANPYRATTLAPTTNGDDRG